MDIKIVLLVVNYGGENYGKDLVEILGSCYEDDFDEEFVNNMIDIWCDDNGIDEDSELRVMLKNMENNIYWNDGDIYNIYIKSDKVIKRIK